MTMTHQIGNINKEIEIKLKNGNSGVEKYTCWNGKFTTGVQLKIWTGKTISKLEDRSLEIIQS